VDELARETNSSTPYLIDCNNFRRTKTFTLSDFHYNEAQNRGATCAKRPNSAPRTGWMTAAGFLD
jgi:hypothetical protein